MRVCVRCAGNKTGVGPTSPGECPDGPITAAKYLMGTLRPARFHGRLTLSRCWCQWTTTINPKRLSSCCLLVASISEGVIHLFQVDLQDPAKPRISVAELCYIERAFRAGSHSRRECQACQQICDLARITDAYYLSAAGHREVSLRGSFQCINFAIHECEADDCGQTIE